MQWCIWYHTGDKEVSWATHHIISSPDHPREHCITGCTCLLHDMYYALHKHNVTRYIPYPGCIAQAIGYVVCYVTLRYSMLLHVLQYVLSVYAYTLHHLLL